MSSKRGAYAESELKSGHPSPPQLSWQTAYRTQDCQDTADPGMEVALPHMDNLCVLSVSKRWCDEMMQRIISNKGVEGLVNGTANKCMPTDISDMS
jgi:hypothetical protein